MPKLKIQYSMNNKINSFMKIVLSFLLIILFSSCKSIEKSKTCSEVTSKNNLGPSVNSPDSESLINSFENQIYFLQYNNDEYNIFQLSDNQTLLTNYNQVVKDLAIKSTGLPTISKLDNNYILFVVSGLTKDTLNRDLITVRLDNKLNKTVINSELLNSEGFDGHPHLDGNRLYFTKEINSQWDIYYSDFVGNEWTKPMPLIEVNTPADEGFYNRNNKIELFSRRNEQNKFDIFRSSTDDNDEKKFSKLSNDFNSSYNDISPCLIGESVYYSSDRPGGCGEFDLYASDFCNNVVLTGQVISEFENIPLIGTVNLYNSNNQLVNSVDIDNSNFTFDLVSNNYYYLEYINNCYSTKQKTEIFYAECNEKENVVLTQEIILPDYNVEFNFEEYDIPFFVTGYYRPNTTENLAELKKLFKHGVIKGKGNTSYIEYPSDKYHDYSYVIDSAFDSAIEFIELQLSNLENACLNKSIKLAIDITGYSDPRKITEKNIYPGPDIYDSEGNKVFKNGETIDNEKLSFLRAYYTGEYIKSKVKTNNDIIYNIYTGGVKSESELPNDLKRKVKISIRLQK